MGGNEEVNSVQVLSIDEERRKFRVIFTTESGLLAGNDTRHGKFQFTLPAPTALANSDHFRNARIKIESLTATSPDAINDATWAIGTAPAGQAIKTGGVIVALNTPSSQVVHNKTFAGADVGVGNNEQIGFQQFIPLRVNNVLTFGGGGAIANDGASWQGDGTGAEGIICGNPFNQSVQLTLKTPVVDQVSCYLASPGGGGGLLNQIGNYVVSFIVEMIPNKGGC